MTKEELLQIRLSVYGDRDEEMCKEIQAELDKLNREWLETDEQANKE